MLFNCLIFITWIIARYLSFFFRFMPRFYSMNLLLMAWKKLTVWKTTLEMLVNYHFHCIEILIFHLVEFIIKVKLGYIRSLVNHYMIHYHDEPCDLHFLNNLSLIDFDKSFSFNLYQKLHPVSFIINLVALLALLINLV